MGVRQFSLVGTYTSESGFTLPPGEPNVGTPILESLLLAEQVPYSFSLNTDAPLLVPLPGALASGVNVLIVKASSKVRVRVTSSDGSQQAWPVGTFVALVCDPVDITAIDLTRLPGVDTSVDVFIGQSA